MTIQLMAEDERLIQELLRTGAFPTAEEAIHRALTLWSPRETPYRKPRKNLADVLSALPFAGSELNLERQKDYPKPLDLHSGS